MIIIPEIETIVILPPKTASTSVIKAIKKRYDNSFQLYRHMEADGIPFGYDRWKKVGIVRNPIERLWSLYWYCKSVERFGFEEYQEKIRKSVDRSFEDWILNNEIIFTDPNSSRDPLEYFPKYAILHAIPENRKSQYIYLRPDLGTKIFLYNEIEKFEEELDIRLSKLNITSKENIPTISMEVQNFINRYHKWDLLITNSKGIEQ